MSTGIERRVAKLERDAKPLRPRTSHFILNRGENGSFYAKHGRAKTDAEMDLEEAELFASGTAVRGDEIMRIIVRIVSPPAYDRAVPVPAADPAEVQPRAEMLAVAQELARAREEAMQPAPQPKRIAPMIARLQGMDLAPTLGHGRPSIKL